MSPQFFVLTTAILLTALVLLSYWQDRRVTRAAPPAGKMVETEEGTVHILTRGTESGDKLPVVLVHGSFTNALDMDLDLAGALGRDRLVLMPDRPGHGFSERPERGHRLDVQVAA
ncbi:MAG: hypothetical protein AAFO62_05610, partial [Pseudomonadota bacterium]